MSISHAPPDSHEPDISVKSTSDTSKVSTSDTERPLPDLERIVPVSTAPHPCPPPAAPHLGPAAAPGPLATPQQTQAC